MSGPSVYPVATGGGSSGFKPTVIRTPVYKNYSSGLGVPAVMPNFGGFESVPTGAITSGSLPSVPQLNISGAGQIDYLWVATNVWASGDQLMLKIELDGVIFFNSNVIYYTAGSMIPIIGGGYGNGATTTRGASHMPEIFEFTTSFKVWVSYLVSVPNPAWKEIYYRLRS